MPAKNDGMNHGPDLYEVCVHGGKGHKWETIRLGHTYFRCLRCDFRYVLHNREYYRLLQGQE